MNISLQLEKLHCNRGATITPNPYMWCIFFKADGDCIRISDSFRLLGDITTHSPKGSHRNLKQTTLNDTIQIPDEIGKWKTSLKPMFLPHFNQAIVPGFVGMIGIVLNEGEVSNEGMESGRRALVNHIGQSFNKIIHNLKPSQIDLLDIENSLTKYFTEESKKYLNNVADVVVNAIKGKQSIFQNIWSLVKKDELIGQHFWIFNSNQIKDFAKPHSFETVFNHEKFGSFKLQGKLKVIV